MLPWANSADDKLMIFFLFFLENRIWHSCNFLLRRQFAWSVKFCFWGQGDNLHEVKKKYQSLLLENFKFLEVKFFLFLNRHVFVMEGTFSQLLLKISRRWLVELRQLWQLFYRKHHLPCDTMRYDKTSMTRTPMARLPTVADSNSFLSPRQFFQ